MVFYKYKYNEECFCEMSNVLMNVVLKRYINTLFCVIFGVFCVIVLINVWSLCKFSERTMKRGVCQVPGRGTRSAGLIGATRFIDEIYVTILT